MIRVFLLSFWAIWLTATAVQARDVTVFAAASLKSVLDEAAGDFTEATGTPVALSYAGSSALARQIQQGAPADLFISANIDWMDVLERDGLLHPDTRRVLAGNRLVLAGPPGEMLPLDDAAAIVKALGSDGRLAMALIDAVPAGIYGKAALDSLALWGVLAPTVVQTDNVRAALRLVLLGEAQLGIVYATDVTVSDAVAIRATFPESSHPAIRYPAALVADSAHPQAGALLDYLAGPAGQALFARHGFVTGLSR